MVTKFKNTKLYLEKSFSEQLKKIVKAEITRSRARQSKTGRSFNSPINYTGTLANSLSSYLQDTSDGFTLNLEGLEYGKAVDEGTNSGFPPIESIVSWIQNKPVKLYNLRGGSLTQSKIRGIAFAISRSINLRGIAPTNFIDDAIQEALSKLEAISDPMVQDIMLNIEDILLKAGYIKKGDNYTIENGTN